MIRKIFKYLLYLIILTLVAIQFINRPKKLSEPIDSQNDIIALLGVDSKMTDILKNNCYDCHSNQPEYPWYSKIAPISWWIVGHMDHGREELNFSKWGEYSKRRKNKKLGDMLEEVMDGDMPLPSYTWIHGKLTDQEKRLLESWVNQEIAKLESEN